MHPTWNMLGTRLKSKLGRTSIPVAGSPENGVWCYWDIFSDISKNIAIQKRKNNIVPLGISCVKSSKGYSTSISWDSTLNWLIRVTHRRCFISGSMKSCMLISVTSQILPCGMAATKKSSLDPWNNGALKTLEGFSSTIHFRTKQFESTNSFAPTKYYEYFFLVEIRFHSCWN